MCCGVSLQIGTPSPTSPEQGAVEFDVTLGPLCSPGYDQRGKPEDAYELEMLLDAVLKQNCRVVDLSELCIEREKYAFQLDVHVVCLSAAGNLQDAALLAAMAALRNVRLPEVVLGATEAPRISRDGSKSRPLTLRCCPVPATVGLVGQQLLLDPSSAEMQGIDGVIRCVVLEDGSLCYVSQVDKTGTGLASAELSGAVDLCRASTNAVRAKLLAMGN